MAQRSIALCLLVSIVVPDVAFAQSGANGISGGGTLTDRSGTIASANTSQQVFAINTSRAYCEIQAIGTADLWIAIGHVAAANTPGSYWLPAGSLFRCPNPPPLGAINALSAAAGAAFSAYEWAR